MTEEQPVTALSTEEERFIRADPAPGDWRVTRLLATLDREREAVADLRASLAAEVGLGAAWAAVVEALPNGDAMRGHRLYRYGHWRMRVVGPWDIEHDGYRPTWQAIAEPYNAAGVGDDHEIEALGPTPTAALEALRAALTSEATE